MYYITELNNGKFACIVTIQDGSERWFKDTKQEAIYSVIQSARVLNHAYITEEDIEFSEEPPLQSSPAMTKNEKKLLDEIKSGHKVVLNFNDYRLKYRITEKECELIQKIREGEVKLA